MKVVSLLMVLGMGVILLPGVVLGVTLPDSGPVIFTPTQIRTIEGNDAPVLESDAQGRYTVPPILYPGGPGCAPSDPGCDILGGAKGMLRDVAEGENALAATFWEGVTLISPLWDSGLTSVREDLYPLKSLAETSFVGEDARTLLDRLFRNVTMYSLFDAMGNLRTGEISNPTEIEKSAPGLFPLGHQYVLKDAVKNAMNTARQNLPADASIADHLRFIPNHKYLIVSSKEHRYENDLTRPLFSDALERQLRLKLNHEEVGCKTDCEDLPHGAMDGLQERSRDYRYTHHPLPRDQRFFPYSSPTRYSGNVIPYSPVNLCFARGGRMPSMQDMVVRAYQDPDSFLQDFAYEDGGRPLAYLTSDMVLNFDGQGVRVASLTAYASYEGYVVVPFEIDHSPEFSWWPFVFNPLAGIFVNLRPFPNEIEGNSGIRSHPHNDLLVRMQWPDHRVHARCIYD